MTPPKEDHNREIYRRYLEGARAVDLAAKYGMWLQRIYVIIRREGEISGEPTVAIRVKPQPHLAAVAKNLSASLASDRGASDTARLSRAYFD